MKMETMRRRLEAQGFCEIDDDTLRELGPWMRWSPMLCSVVMATGTLLASPVILAGLVPFAVVGAIHDRHPFDYFYNGLVRRLTGTRPLPPHGAQRRFACAMGSAWLLATAWAFHSGAMLAGYVLGGCLTAVALLVSVTHICIPSAVYNVVFGRKTAPIPGGR